MSVRLLCVNVVSVQDSFVHLSSKLVRELNTISNNTQPLCLKVMTLDDVQAELYVSCSQTPYNSNGDEMFNISHEFLITLGLKVSQLVLITVVDHVYPLERIYVTPLTEEDWDLLVLNNIPLQHSILQQLQIVYKNEILPIWVSKFIHLKICIGDLGFGDFQMGLLKDTTEIVIKSDVIKPGIISNKDNLASILQKNMKDQNECIPLTKFDNQLIFRTIFVNDTLLEFDSIYDYCALISKLHMSMLFKNNDPYSSGNSFVKVTLLKTELDQTKSKENQIVQVPYLIIRLCPLNPFMNNVEEMEIINWPTIYVTNTLSKMFGLNINSKVVLEPIIRMENEICDVQNICIYPITRKSNLDEKSILNCTIQLLKNEVVHRKMLVLNNKSSLHVVYNTIMTIDVMVTFFPSNIPYIYLNEYNIGMLKFTIKTKDMPNIVPNHGVANDKTATNQFIDHSISITFRSEEYYDIKCFKDMKETGSLCLKLGLNCYNTLPQTFMAYDNLLITGAIGSGKTTIAKMLCHELSKCPYFVKIIWIKGRFLAGKLWDIVQKILTSQFQESLYYQPVVIVIDDFDALCHLNSEPNEHADISKFYLKSFHLLLRMIEEYTNYNNSIRVICTAKPFNEEQNNLFSKKFKHVFKTVIQVPSIDKENRKAIISKRLYPLKSYKTDKYLDEICEKMDSYVIQDLIDFCDKVLFDNYKGESDKLIIKSVLNNAFEKTVPLSLHNVGLFKDKTINFSLIGGLKDAKQTIIETIIWPSIHSDIFSKCPLKLQFGLLLYGPPGSGKTLLAKAVAGESNLNFISINGPEILSKYVGESEHSVRKIFQRAQNARPCIIFFDEFESIAPKRGSDQTGVTDRVVNQFLTQLDGVDTSEGIFVITATSRPDLIDGALLRPGRIGIKLHCPMPTTADREDILGVLCTDLKLSEDVDLYEIALKTNNFTGADLKGLVYTVFSIAEKKISKEQADSLISDDDNALSEPTITADDFWDALNTTSPSLQQSDIDHFEEIHKLFSKEKMANANINMTKLQKTTYA
ncbi:ATPase, AAA-type, core,ATPase, AAA-type, conserved site,Peroxisome biogenesis factor 1, N-terminal [Cinara cedri]|uniref:Peroxisomal ATPase PEX1 n=1 Tax=Cinara cedri TaxID=506608 RepID=A0A5E4NIC4_9HEMI|nr:ATPase, AAA-type, core,ATPase, AAA-type, conserved site,Peroxisome biogenesis factor 1, N-terminal [Cinara cedri]